MSKCQIKYYICINKNTMTHTILKVIYKFNGEIFENNFILFDGCKLENLLAITAQIISVKLIK